MDSSALTTLASLTVSRARVVLFGVAAVVIVFLVGMLLQESNVGTRWMKPIAIVILISICVSLNWLIKLRPTPNSVPTLRFMRDHSERVAAIVGLERGSLYLAVVDSEGALLARPMEIVGELEEKVIDLRVSAGRPDAKLVAVVAIAKSVCPNARVGTARDEVGLKSLARLARDAAARSSSEP